MPAYCLRLILVWFLALLPLGLSVPPCLGLAQAETITLTERNHVAAGVLTAQQELIAEVRNPQLKLQAFNAWLKSQAKRYEQIFARSEDLRLSLFPDPAMFKDAQGLFLNNYKSETELSPAARQQEYLKELALYQKHGQTQTQTLDLKALLAGPAEQGYDFVILPNQQILIAPIPLRDPTLGTVSGQLANHSILAAGGPVRAAGNFFLFQSEGKRVVFIANKSGHYLPDYASLNLLKQRLVALGLAPEQVYLLSMGGYYANVVYKFFYQGQIRFPAAFKPRSLFEDYYTNWQKNWQSLELMPVLALFQQQPEQPISDELFKALKTRRKQALYLGSVYFLMDQRHTPPADFERYVDILGKLMDAVTGRHQAAIRAQAQALEQLLQSKNILLLAKDFKPSDNADFQAEISRMELLMKPLLQADQLMVHEMHLVRINFKHLLFLMMALHERDPDQLLPDLMMFHLQQITDYLGTLHDQAVEDDLSGKIAYDDARISLTPKVREYLLDALVRNADALRDWTF